MKKLDVGVSEIESVIMNAPDIWHRWFKSFLWATIIIPIILVIAQLYFTQGGYSTDIDSVNNWETLTDTFALPIAVFTGFVALTTLIGMYHRSLQLSEQLSKVERQLALVERKDNFQLYFEHVKQLEEKCNFLLNLYKTKVFKNFCDDYIPTELLVIDYHKLYKSTYPNNSILDIKDLDFEDALSTEAMDCVDALKMRLDVLSLEDLDENKLSSIGLCFEGLGVFIHWKNGIQRESSIHRAICNFLLDIIIILRLLHSLSLIEEQGLLIKELFSLAKKSSMKNLT